MPRPPATNCHRLTRAVSVVLLSCLLLFVAPATAQLPDYRYTFIGETIGGMVFTLVVGGALILVAPEYTRRTTGRIRREPGQTLLYGIGISVVLFIVLLILVVTIVGILAAIPLGLIAIIIAQLGYLAVGRVVSYDWTIALLTAAVIAGLTNGVPFLGGFVGFLVGSLGLGAAYLDYKTDDTSMIGPTPAKSTSGTNPQARGTTHSQQSPGEPHGRLARSESAGETDDSSSNRSSERSPDDDTGESASDWEWGFSEPDSRDVDADDESDGTDKE